MLGFSTGHISESCLLELLPREQIQRSLWPYPSEIRLDLCFTAINNKRQISSFPSFPKHSRFSLTRKASFICSIVPTFKCSKGLERVKLGWEYSTVAEHLLTSLSSTKGKETQGVILQTPVSPRESSLSPPKPQGCLSETHAETHAQKSPAGHTKQVSLE